MKKDENRVRVRFNPDGKDIKQVLSELFKDKYKHEVIRNRLKIKE